MRDDHLRGIARRRRYEELARDFRWDIPETFNLATDVIDRWAAEQDGIALIWENAAGAAAAYRYSDISRLSCQLASALAAAGVSKGDRVIVMLPRVPEWQIALIACVRMGAVAIPCIEMLTARDIAYRVRNSGAKVAICRTGQIEKFAEVEAEVPVRIAVESLVVAGDSPAVSPPPATAGWRSWEQMVREGSDRFASPRIGIEDPVVMYYTSGSTGHPKGVLHAARALYAWRMQAYLWLDLEPGDRIWCTADTGWSKAGTSVIWGPWSAGATAFQYDGPFEPSERLRLLAKHRITVFCASSTELLRLGSEPTSAYDLTALRRTVSAGEAVRPVAAERWREATGCLVSEAYGQTEALMMVLNYPSEAVRVGSMGRRQATIAVAGSGLERKAMWRF